VLAILAPTLTRELGWRETDYAGIVSWFSVAYGVGLLGMGRVMDRIGVRVGLSLAVGVWSLASMAHALVRSVAGFGVARALLGIGESGNFPAAVKTVAEWFPQRERALATGIFNAGTNVGVVVAALLVPWIALVLGWRWAFLATGGLGHRRLDLGGADQARLECEPWPQDGAARRGAGHRPDDVRAGGRHDVGGGEHRRGGGRSAPMVVGQPVHDGERHVPPARRRVGGRPGRVRGDVQRLRVPATHRRRARGGGWQLRADLRGAGARVRRGAGGHACPRAAPRAHCRRAVIRSVYHPSPMKITDIRATPVSVPLEAPLRHANGCHWGRFVRTIVEVETDSGLVGLGELGGGGESASAAVHGLKPYLLGRDPTRIEELRFLIA